MPARIATDADLDPVAGIMAAAFYEDPVWGWALPDPARRLEQHRAAWGFLVEGRDQLRARFQRGRLGRDHAAPDPGPAGRRFPCRDCFGIRPGPAGRAPERRRTGGGKPARRRAGARQQSRSGAGRAAAGEGRRVVPVALGVKALDRLRAAASGRLAVMLAAAGLSRGVVFELRG